MMRQRYVVLLRETIDKQVWLAYNDFGRIGNANYNQAFRFETRDQARWALIKLPLKWPDAQVLATLVEIDE